MLSELVNVTDAFYAAAKNKLRRTVFSRSSDSYLGVVGVKGWVDIVARERGKKVPGLCRSGHNVWTNVGKEYLAVLMQKNTGTGTNRSDRVAYIGAGTGSQPEEPAIIGLVEPVQVSISGDFLVAITPPTWPLSPSKTTARYYRHYGETELTTLSVPTLSISEFGLFTDGGQDDPALARDTTIGNASKQSPVAYKTFEPIGKTQNLSLDVYWEIRF
jgi:hypothetical protein